MLVRDLIRRNAANKPKSVAYICGNRRANFGQMDSRSDKAAAAMAGLGLSAGEATGILAPESIEVYEHFYACFKMGAIRTGLNRRFSSSELIHVVKDAGVRLILAHSDCQDLLLSVADQLAELGVKLIGYGGPHNLTYDYEHLLSETTEKYCSPAVDADSPAIYTYTSGTTGNPKGVVISDKAVRTVIEGAPASFGFSSDDIFYCPLANAWAAVVANLLGLCNGMTTAIPDKEYETKCFIEEVKSLKVTIFLLAPTMLQWLLDALAESDSDMDSVRMVMYGSAPASPKLIEAVSKRFKCGLLQAYGVSETCAGWITNLTPRDHKKGLEEKPKLLQSAGRAPSYFDLSIRDENGIEVSQGEIGEVWVRSDCIMNGYLNLPEQTKEVLKEDGWLITNDMGMQDEEGYLYLKDRRKFMIVTGGINVFPAHVEAVISSHESIAEIAVVGVPHKVWGEAVVAVIYPRPGFEGVTQYELLEYCKDKLGKVMMPKYIHLVSEPLPKSVNLKIQKHLIQDWFVQDPSLLPATF
ncbi:AMP-binding protein [Alteromonas sp. M12]|uniref:class I adenylate-forming enzyme family protein n=1 Tax=Alteromonas sp. M12 TaxID=3135644 RepID=UPI00319DA496